MQKTILIVDDDKSLRDFLKKTLSDYDFNVVVAEDGERALEIVSRKIPDLVILDLGLPKISGETVCVEIKKNYPKIIVIVLTAQSKSIDAVRSLRIGADDYMSKPFTFDELLARIEVRLKNTENKKPKVKEVIAQLNKITFRESVFLIGIRLAATQLLFGLIFLLTVSSVSFLNQYFILDNSFSFYLIFLVLLILVDVAVSLSIILKWHFEYIEITSSAIIKHVGIFYKKEETFACNFIETITLNQSLPGIIFNYGTLELFDPALKEPIYIFNITGPKKYSDVIKKIFSKKNEPSAIFISQDTKSNDALGSLQ